MLAGMNRCLIFIVLGWMASGALAQPVGRADVPLTARPNILWIVSEDNNPYLGCYRDTIARTPTIDALAKQGILYENCFSQAPVCAPSRFTLITGVYATSAGPAHQMRAAGKIGDVIRGFPAYLRAAGYYTTNNAKTDYNAPINMKDAWDESSKKAHWRNRKAGQPFFAVFNHEVTHESSVFGKFSPLPNGTDPAKVRIPAYTPDCPETRADRALYYDNMHRLDNQVAALLKQLDDDGLTEDTIVFYYGDNGGVLPRSKRFCYDSGLHVPLIVRIPKKFAALGMGAQAGARLTAPVSFVDFAPTILSLVGIDAPKYFEGHAFLGPKKGADKEYAFGFRGRMDERYDMVRTIRSDRYRYTRNYSPDVPYSAHNQYQWQQKGYQAWEKLYKGGQLTGAPLAFWQAKPTDEFYDVQADPDEVKNLALNPTRENATRMAEMRAALRKHIIATRDNGFMPEGAAAEGYAASRDEKAYPIAEILAAADLAAERHPAHLAAFEKGLKSENEVLRYWAAMGCMMLRNDAAAAKDALIEIATKDPSPRVRVPAAEALVWIAYSDRRSGAPVLDVPQSPVPPDLALAGKGLETLTALLTHEDMRVRLQAANALDLLGGRAKPVLAAIRKASTEDKDDYVKRMTRYTAAVLAGEKPPIEGEEK